MITFTAHQIIAHLVGDYWLQSSWMAQRKIDSTLIAMLHALVYTLPFLTITTESAPLLVIVLTHCLIDRFRLAKYLCFFSNFLSPPSNWKAWSNCKKTGYHDGKLDWIAVWLMIIVDNTMHLVCNAAALTYLQ